MDDISLFCRSSGRERARARKGGRDEPRDCGGASDQPVVRLQMDQAQARDRLLGLGPDRRLQAPHAGAGESADCLRERIASGPFTLRGLSAEMAERGIKTHPRAVLVFVHAEGLSFKNVWPAQSDVGRPRVNVRIVMLALLARGHNRPESSARIGSNPAWRSVGRHPTLPSRLIVMSFCASTANSIGNCCNTSRTKPLTISAVASSADRPRCRQ
jgi:hypothetical protein